MNFNLVGILFLLVLLFGVSETLAATQITLNTNKNAFSAGDTVVLTGKVTDAPNQLIAIEVKDPDGNTILIRTVKTGAEGSFVLEFKIPSTGKAGSYDIVANAEVDGETITESTTISSSQEPSFQQTSQSGKGGGCLIATAAFGSELAPQIQMLRETRDNIVLKTQSGSSFMTTFNSIYYTFAPTVAEWERQNPIFKEVVKATITPLITTLSILNYVDIDSEAEMLAYGIGVILLNIGIYFVAPTFVIIRLKQYKK